MIWNVSSRPLRGAEDTFVIKGTLICIVETTKTSYDIVSPMDGYFYCFAKVGDILKVEDVVAVISDSKRVKEDLFKEIVKDSDLPKVGNCNYKEGRILIKSMGLDVTEITNFILLILVH